MEILEIEHNGRTLRVQVVEDLTPKELPVYPCICWVSDTDPNDKKEIRIVTSLRGCNQYITTASIAHGWKYATPVLPSECYQPVVELSFPREMLVSNNGVRFVKKTIVRKDERAGEWYGRDGFAWVFASEINLKS